MSLISVQLSFLPNPTWAASPFFILLTSKPDPVGEALALPGKEGAREMRRSRTKDPIIHLCLLFLLFFSLNIEFFLSDHLFPTMQGEHFEEASSDDKTQQR